MAERVELERARLEAVLQNLPVGVWITDAEGRIVGKNAAADAIWAGDAPLVGGVSEYQKYAAWREGEEEPLPASAYPVAQVLVSGKPVEPVELRIRRFDGTQGTVLVSASPYFDASGALAGVVGINVDITRRKRSEQALREAKEKADRANQAKSQFLSVMSHELRTPLAAVLGYAELLGGEVVGPMNERQKEFVGRIRASTSHLVTIIEEILTFSRADAGREEVRPREEDVSALAGAVVAMLTGEAATRGLALRLAGADAPVKAFTDGARLSQILVNLVGNALKYTESGAVDIELVPRDERIELRVRDTGPGIAADRLEEIFEPFVQLDTAKRGQGGTGLGLAIARRQARLLGGDVTVESTVGKGSTFTLAVARRLEA